MMCVPKDIEGKLVRLRITVLQYQIKSGSLSAIQSNRVRVRDILERWCI